MYINQKTIQSKENDLDHIDKLDTITVFDLSFTDTAAMFATFIDDEETIKDLITGEIAGLISLLTSLAMTVAAFPEKLDNLVLMINDLKKELEMNDRTTNKSYFIDSLFDTLLVCASGKANGIDKDLAELYKKKINKQRASTDI